MKIRKYLVSQSIAKRVTYSGKNSKKYIVIHETANIRKGANANAHARLQASGNSRAASWHYTVDDKEIVQSFSDDAQCWHAGNKYYNQNSIAIEICVNQDGDFKKAVENAIKLTKYLMDKYKIPASNVIQHNQASGKNCPRYLRSGDKGIKWSDFKNKLIDGTNKSSSLKNNNSKPIEQTTDKQKKTIAQMADEVLKGIHGNGHEQRRKSLGISKEEYEKVRKEVNRRLGVKTTSSTNINKISKTTGKTSITSGLDFKVGQKVVIKTTAKTYATGQKIPSQYKGKTYTIQQVKHDRVLLRELYSWVRKSDLITNLNNANKSKSISQMADEIIRGLHGNGHEQRRKSLGIDKATYEKVRAEVNRRLK